VEYLVRLHVSSLIGQVGISLPGVSIVVDDPGDYTFSMTPTGNGNISIFPGTDSAVCVSLVSVKAYGNAVQPTVVDEEGDPVTEAVTLVRYEGDRATITIGTGAMGPGCYTVLVTGECTDTIYESQTVRLFAEDDPCMILVQTCNDTATMGFTDDFRPFVRVFADLSRPRWNMDLKEIRGSNGRLLRSWAQKVEEVTLYVETAGESLHRYLASLPLWHHVYLGEREHIAIGSTYAPEYGDAFRMSGPAQITLEPTGRVVTSRLCVEPGPGCVPPPGCNSFPNRVLFVVSFFDENNSPTPGVVFGDNQQWAIMTPPSNEAQLFQGQSDIAANGPHCMVPSNELGQPSTWQDVGTIQIQGVAISSIDFGTSLDEAGNLVMLDVRFDFDTFTLPGTVSRANISLTPSTGSIMTTVDLSAVPASSTLGARTFGIDNFYGGAGTITNVIMPIGNDFAQIIVADAALTVASVDAICNSVDLTFPNGAPVINLSGGTSAAPTAASAAARAAIIAAGGLVITN